MGLPAKAYVGVGPGAARVDLRPGGAPAVRFRLVTARFHVGRLPVAAAP